MQKRAARTAYEMLREAIINGIFDPGESLTEERLTTHLGMSRTPVREALVRLTTEGLVRMVDNKGAFVREITPVDVAEILQLRSLLEGFAARSCVVDIDTEAVGELKASLELIEPKEEHFELMADLGIRLHRVVFDSAGNRRLTRIVEMLTSQILWTRSLAEKIPGRMARSQEEHLALAEALCRRDPAGSEECMRRHIDNITREMLDPSNIPRVFNHLMRSG